MENREFRGIWIPRDIWLDNRLNALEKAIFCEIDSLDIFETGCFATNAYFAEFCQCSETKVSQTISKLTELGYIEFESIDGRRILRVAFQKMKGGVTENVRGGLQKMQGKTDLIQHNNNKETLINNINIYIAEIVAFLNEKVGARYRPSSAVTRKHITARLNEGYTVDDFKAVITKKAEEWKGTEFEKFLCPETLFGTKFEKYLNQQVAKKEKKAVYQGRESIPDNIYQDIGNFSDDDI